MFTIKKKFFYKHLRPFSFSLLKEGLHDDSGMFLISSHSWTADDKGFLKLVINES